MPLTTRPLIRASRLGSLARLPQPSRVFYSGGSRLPGGTPGEASEQAIPLGLYYEAVLNKPQPIPDVKPEEPPTSSPKSPRSTAKKAPTKRSKDEATPASSSSATGPETSAKPATAQEKSPRGQKSQTTAA